MSEKIKEQILLEAMLRDMEHRGVIWDNQHGFTTASHSKEELCSGLWWDHRAPPQLMPHQAVSPVQHLIPPWCACAGQL